MNVGGPDLIRPAFLKKSLEVRDKKSERFKVAADALLLTLKMQTAMLWRWPHGRWPEEAGPYLMTSVKGRISVIGPQGTDFCQ